jgi:predicted acetyltransferase
LPDLIAPTTRLHASWLDAYEEVGRGVYLEGTGFSMGRDFDSADGFGEWVGKLLELEDRGREPRPGLVHCTYRWMVEGDRYLGGIALRHELNDWLLEVGGHIGYSVRPSERRRGLASWALGETLRTARELGLERVMISCKPANEASRRTIEKAGGVFEDIRGEGDDEVRRYWIAV